MVVLRNLSFLLSYTEADIKTGQIICRSKIVHKMISSYDLLIVIEKEVDIMFAEKNKLLCLILLLVTCLITGCSSSNSASDPAKLVLKPSSQEGCSRGFIRPPGVSHCINISDIIAGRTKALAPVGLCPADWRRLKSKGFCLPKYSLIGCGTKTFSCGFEKNDSFRVIPESPKCPEGTIVVTTDAPLFGENGALFFGTRITLSCGPPSKIDPV